MNALFGDRRLAQVDDELATTSEILVTLPALRATVDAKLDTETHGARSRCGAIGLGEERQIRRLFLENLAAPLG